jgi:hypothetical protein
LHHGATSKNGEDRIRTCGKELTLRRISNPVL